MAIGKFYCHECKSNSGAHYKVCSKLNGNIDMTRKVECRHCGTHNSAGTPCRCLSSTADLCKSKDLDRFLQGVEQEIEKAVSLITNGNDYEGLVRLHGVLLAFRLKRST